MRHPERRVTEPKDLGILMNMNLQKIKLGEVCRFINGRAYSQPELLDSGKYKVLRVGNIFEGNHWYYSDMELDDDKYCNEGDLLYSWACTFGPYIWHGPKTIYHYHIWKVEPNQSLVDKHFLYYFLNHQTKGFMGSTHGSTMIHITKENMENFEVLLPSLSDQKKIASVLSALDDKIALNKKMNQKLEAMAKRLYDYWFVQYDFPDKNGHPYKTTGGKMEYNETLKREIPEGWNDGALSDIANITMGQSPDGASYNEDGEGMIFYQGSTDFGMRFPTVRQYTTAPTRFAKKGDILMSVRAPVGAVNIANTDCCIGRGLSALNSKLGSLSHLYFLIDVFKKTFENKNTVGTTFGSITKDELYALPVVIPDKKVIEQFEKMAKPIFDRQMKLGEESNRLIKLRDKLLPLLMNGQVEVK